jgi:hypothetical protein
MVAALSTSEMVDQFVPNFTAQNDKTFMSGFGSLLLVFYLEGVSL